MPIDDIDLDGNWSATRLVGDDRVTAETGAQFIKYLCGIHQPNTPFEVNERGPVSVRLWDIVSKDGVAPWRETCRRMPAPMSWDEWSYTNGICSTVYNGSDGKFLVYRDIIGFFDAPFIMCYVRKEVGPTQADYNRVVDVLWYFWSEFNIRIGGAQSLEDRSLRYSKALIENYALTRDYDKQEDADDNIGVIDTRGEGDEESDESVDEEVDAMDAGGEGGRDAYDVGGNDDEEDSGGSDSNNDVDKTGGSNGDDNSEPAAKRSKSE